MSRHLFTASAVLPFLLLGSALTPVNVRAGETAAAWDQKLTVSAYNFSQSGLAEDVNLRAGNGTHTVWGGYYRSADFDQARAGWEYTLKGAMWQLVPSLQVASQGLLSGSFGAQVGDRVYGVFGWSRTNLKPYMNLNFDPGESWTLGIGTRNSTSSTTLFVVKDDRLNTDQLVSHMVWRHTTTEQTRWTLDLSSKTGRPAEGEPRVSGVGVSLGYDLPPYFVRIGWEQNVFFSEENQSRAAFGMRF